METAKGEPDCMDERYCQTCRAILANDEHEICRWCSKDYLISGTVDRIKDDMWIDQRYDIEDISKKQGSEQ